MLDVERFVSELHEYMARALAPLSAEIKALQQRLDQRDKQIPFEFYKGVHRPGHTYAKGEFVTHEGGMWLANSTTAKKPGDGEAWTLVVKRGRDGRDLR